MFCADAGPIITLSEATARSKERLGPQRASQVQVASSDCFLPPSHWEDPGHMHFLVKLLAPPLCGRRPCTYHVCSSELAERPSHQTAEALKTHHTETHMYCELQRGSCRFGTRKKQPPLLSDRSVGRFWLANKFLSDMSTTIRVRVS